ncbi:hypothetical protein DPMN_056198 [Dreissena polymorpha]|uniref:Uncharacterized protein n=1 Tax=Dreissena polymorpha TaxID=45954 RepID=A0A9D4CS38_DREPO|nr:hypothetical protein DPMN_056198 [Dreissena polymorpha]
MDAVTLNEKKREKKKLNWTKIETEVLAAAYIEQHALINGNFSSTLSAKDNDLAWEKLQNSEYHNSGIDPEKDFRHENKTEKEIKTTAPINETNWRGSSNYTGAVGGEKVIGEESIVGFGGVDTFAVQRTQQPMIAEHHGQSCSTMCVEPTVALEPQVVGGVATPNQKTKMSPSTKNNRKKTSEDSHISRNKLLNY